MLFRRCRARLKLACRFRDFCGLRFWARVADCVRSSFPGCWGRDLSSESRFIWIFRAKFWWVHVAATRTMAFALACGLFWSPIITSVQTYVQQHAEQQTVTSAQQASTLASQAAGQSGTEAESTIKAASSQISEALTKLPTVATPNSRDQIVASSKSVVASIAAPKAGVASVEALKNIGAASVKGGSPQVTLLAIEKLKQIEASAPTPATRVAAEKAVASLASASPGIVQEPAKQGPAR
jgi:hypothetical protein